ncbi:MAG: DUF2806 domain-containing protein [Clostridia bacterium]|jgi:hypothetical protein
MESLISGDVLKPISDLGIVLLNKVEKATGWIFSTTTAKKEGYKNIIEEISKRDDINPIDRTVIISNFRKIKREHKNKTQIVDKAISLLEKGDNPEKLDNDWVLRFFEFCKAVSNEDLQYVWAKILANECKENSNNSFKLLNTISEISNNEINLIRKILKECNYGIRNFEAIGIIFIKNEYLEDIDIKYDEIIKLEDFGIMKREITTLQDEISFDLENETIRFIRKPEKKGYLNLTKYANFYRFTHIGMEIIELINEEINGNQFKKLEKAFDYEYNVILEKK